MTPTLYTADGAHWTQTSADADLIEALDGALYYDWEYELANKMVDHSVKVVNTTNGLIGYIYRRRLVIPDRHFGGRTPDKWGITSLPSIKKLA